MLQRRECGVRMIKDLFGARQANEGVDTGKEWVKMLESSFYQCPAVARHILDSVL
ncbi:hypothetical protein FRC08_012829, partial [Ceratobasidium sp. 394]